MLLPQGLQLCPAGVRLLAVFQALKLLCRAGRGVGELVFQSGDLVDGARDEGARRRRQDIVAEPERLESWLRRSLLALQALQLGYGSRVLLPQGLQLCPAGVPLLREPLQLCIAVRVWGLPPGGVQLPLQRGELRLQAGVLSAEPLGLITDSCRRTRGATGADPEE